MYNKTNNLKRYLVEKFTSIFLLIVRIYIFVNIAPIANVNF